MDPRLRKQVRKFFKGLFFFGGGECANSFSQVIELTTASESSTESTSAAEKKKTAKPKKQDKKKDDKKKKENIFQRSWGGVKKAFGWMKEKVKKLFSHN